MRKQGFSPTVKLQQPLIPYQMPQNPLKSQFIMRRPLFDHEHLFPQNPQINNYAQPFRRRRNGSLRLKNEPSEEKMRKIDEKRGKYKRSTNNSHKKYTGVARRLLLKYLREGQINRFEMIYESLKNSRTYYFIILTHVKFLLTAEQVREYQQHFIMLMNNKIGFYRKEVERTNNRNFINFRLAEIAEIKYAIKAFNLYFEGKVNEAVEVIYRKNKNIIIKKNQFEQTIHIINNLEENLRQRLNEQTQERDYITPRPPSLDLYHQTMRGGPEDSDALPAVGSYELESAMQNSKKVSKFEETKICPLSGLENSYPLFQSFYPVMFPYGEEPYSQPISLSLICSQIQFQLLEKEQNSQGCCPAVSNKPLITKFESFQEEPLIITPLPVPQGAPKRGINKRHEMKPDSA